MKVIYIAGPYRSRTEYGLELNIRAAERAQIRLMREGWMVFNPHKNSGHLGGTMPDNFFLAGDLEILRRCDAIFMLKKWELSAGAKDELKLARKLKLEIIFEE
jgi:hypothetical protein